MLCCNARMRLLAIPRTAIRRTQCGNGGDELVECGMLHRMFEQVPAMREAWPAVRLAQQSPGRPERRPGRRVAGRRLAWRDSRSWRSFRRLHNGSIPPFRLVVCCKALAVPREERKHGPHRSASHAPSSRHRHEGGVRARVRDQRAVRAVVRAVAGRVRGVIRALRRAGAAAVQGLGVAFLMWNATYPAVIVSPRAFARWASWSSCSNSSGWWEKRGSSRRCPPAMPCFQPA